MNNMHMDQYTHNAFWLDDRITITFQFGPNVIPVLPLGGGSNNAAMGRRTVDSDAAPPTFDKMSAIADLKLNDLNGFLVDNKYPVLNAIDFTDTMRAPDATPPGDPELVGKYLFTSLDSQQRYVPTIMCFFKFDSMGVPSTAAVGSSSAMASMPGNGSANNDHDQHDDGNSADTSDPVARYVNFINRQDTLDYLQKQLQIPIISASPTFLTGSTPYIPVGCPLSPAIPVSEDAHCSSSPGLWPITLPELSTDLERMTGDGVNVIILDTLPRQEDIARAVEGAEEHNLLLLDVVNNVVMQHNHLPTAVDEPNPKQPKTGKDILGRNGGGFRMADHGLFIAGIVRDIAPDAHVECIRALNDFCAGDSTAFVKALESIENRMLLVNPDDGNKQGDLYQKQVVINLSCVVPPDADLIAQGLNPNQVNQLRQELFIPIRDLVKLGVLFAASAGNEGDTRYQPGNPSHVRPDALFPAAFAYKSPTTIPNVYGPGLGNSVIPVGAVDKHGGATAYSCYPGDLGIATYGGDSIKHFKKDESGCFTEAEDIDALIGIYSSLSYPALLLEDCRPTYPVPNAHAWAYWSGTSFATPIIAGLLSRLVQYRLENPGAALPPHVSMPQAMTNLSATRKIAWDRLDPGNGSKPGQMILAAQCAPVEHDDDDKRQERVDVHVTFNE